MAKQEIRPGENPPPPTSTGFVKGEGMETLSHKVLKKKEPKLRCGTIREVDQPGGREGRKGETQTQKRNLTPGRRTRKKKRKK